MCQCLWFLPIHNGRVTNCTPLLGSVDKSAETNFNFPAPPFNHISGICKNPADTWPATTRVLSQGRKREDPGNKVGTTAAVNAAKWLTNLTCSQSVVQFRHLHLHFFFRGQTVACESVANKKSCGRWCASRFHLCSWHVKESSKVPVIQMV